MIRNKKMLILVLFLFSALILYRLVYRAHQVSYESMGRLKSPGVYFFCNPHDRDEDCLAVYRLVDALETSLKGKIPVVRPQGKEGVKLEKQFGIRILPTLVFIDKSGQVKEKIEGEGSDAEIRIKKLSSDINGSVR